MEAVNVSVDYITLTAVPGSREDMVLQTVYDYIRFDEAKHGVDERAIRALGYIGSAVGNVVLGSRKDSRMLRASGADAMKVLSLLPLNETNLRCTRIDVQITCASYFDQENYAKELSSEVLEFLEVHGGNNPPRVTLIDSHGYGDTLNIGRRSSLVYIRVYDKTREQSETGPPWTWRHEVELKSEKATEALTFILRQPDQTHAITAVVLHYLHNRGILMSQSANSIEFSSIPIPRDKTDDDRSLDWLRSTVGGVTRRLIRHGRTSEVLEALGISLEEYE